jgi:5S rRNA maturation endonuclease (ribonuclease M5)
MTAYNRLLDALRDRGRRVVERGDGRATAQCPAHDDNNPSLSVTRIDGSVLIHCHADCQTADVLAALNWEMRDLFDDRNGATYVYPDDRRVHRSEGKQFRQSGNTKGSSLFHADKITDAKSVYVVEGEKDVLAVESAGGTAVCPAMGAGKAHLFDWEPLRDKDVTIVADRDDAGRKHAVQVAEVLRCVAASVRIVEAAVGKDAADHVAADGGLDELVPMVSENGAKLLTDVEHFAARFLAFPTAHHLVVIVLWIVHTWAVQAFYVTPRLVLDSPEPGSGKTRVLEVLALLCRAAKLTLSTTTAALYRRIAAAGEQPPTILQDEADAVFGKTTNPQSEDLRALFNAGYKRGATVDRCEGDAKSMKVREFPVFAPVALAGLAGKMPATITDRAITLHMRRRAPDEHVAEFRERDAKADAEPLRGRIEVWAAANHDALAAARPVMPDGVRDRPAEVWEAILAVADLAGGDWPDRARAACRHFVLDSDPDELSFGARLLRDIRTVFGDCDRVFSTDVVTALTSDPESEWRDLWGKPLDQNRLAKELKRYGVRSNTIRIGAGRAKGYQVDGDDGLAQAWRRYLPNVTMRDKRDSGDIAGQRVTPNDRGCDSRDAAVTGEMHSEQHLFDGVTGVTDVTPTNGFASQNGDRPATDEANAAYCAGLCRDCSAKPHSPGRPRCEECHRIWANVTAGYDR